jgi:hypothetical protein
MPMVGEDRFDPRLRLDLSSGKGSLRGLTDSIDQLNKSENIRMLPPRPPYVDPDGAPTVDYERAIGLVHGRHTQDMHDRHAAALHKICKENAAGFFVHDLGSIETLLTCAARHRDPIYNAAICDVLRTLSLPLNKQRSYDEQRYEDDFAALVRAVSSLLRSDVPAVSLAAAEMLLALVAAAGGPTCVNRERALQTLAKSGGVQNVVATLASEHVTPTVVAAMRLLRSATKDAEVGAQVLRCDDFGALLGLLRLPLGDPVLGMCVEVVWNLLETARAEAAAQLAVPSFVTLLSELLQRTLESSHARETDREMRNELVVLGTLLLQGATPWGRDAVARGGMLAHV